ncbi:glucose transporter GlcU [Priestia megaterium]|uniref:RhaT L-rhamnose-proton symporter family protein n=1 Tax=Priestia megaterium (strain ATCC 14581 / DSM 32 / CCUG 1817 / JCM 2506 / NBRC 15308 / NCIMB 9376 / NCTC 10342 / NRRL B-14308 / VKM B-512 / Ford 19) TaxID=1348623 RepID=A0A0B6AFH2_PRIM2|nr:RhaT/GlcU family sugar-proton symporter [Priestia megaterium]AJI22276.1 RhaT L-rhamnose-proton symporter family protein [Priestia megaterium NBRC 15308 = ATCC 14581]KFM98204.1 RhaT L-rhamnose-proton symporter family protein [Priestia megaterium]KGJ76245.1 glucose transporter GlcU [Priestia megaterium NBRC 15308 = ATCC 14581]MDR4232339.1 glucose uptake protein GlcU [Priestia megaterium]MED3806023.1 RhaT/GlcU family sugar-proton symporter [Priestia megaterium]
MDIFLAVLPAIFWGSIVLFNVKLGGGPYSQTLGTTLGALIFSIGIYIFVHPTFTPLIFGVGVVSGLFWAVGQSNQLKSIDLMGVSKTMPISTGLQLVSTSLFGVIVFHEWSTKTSIILGVLALIFIIVGIVLASLQSKEEKEAEEGKGNFKKGIVILLISTVGYLVYVVVARLFNVDGWSALLPQAIGMVIGGVLLTFKHKPFNKYAIRNIIPGLIWAAGNMFLFISQPKVGVATSFSLSQMGIVISTLGGIIILGEKKTKRQLVGIIIGIILIIIAGVMLGLAKS